MQESQIEILADGLNKNPFFKIYSDDSDDWHKLQVILKI